MKPDNVAAASYCPVCKNSGVFEGLPMLQMWVLGRNGPFNLDLMLRFANQAWECKWRNRRTEAEFP